jgi:Flavin containing amine oxidoreductase
MERLTLETRGRSKGIVDTGEVRTSVGFESFLKDTILPKWFPLSNLTTGGQKILNILNLKKDHSGNVVRDSILKSTESLLSNRDIVPMEPRTRFRVCVVGGGIAGLYCCLELLTECEKAKVDVDVVLLEGQGRLGGRLWTDRATFSSSQNGENFAVELGASWIHGIIDNPLASLAKAANVDFVTTSEDVVMLQSGMQVVNSERDEYAGKLFDKVLDFAVSNVRLSIQLLSSLLCNTC